MTHYGGMQYEGIIFLKRSTYRISPPTRGTKWKEKNEYQRLYKDEHEYMHT